LGRNVRELFIYYRTTLADSTVLQATALAMQARLQAQHTGLNTRLLRRPEAANGLLTWMEIYDLPASPTGVSESLQRDIETAALAALTPLLAGPRHTEVFVTCAS